MRVLLLSAGYGKRMRPLTLTTPKCLIKVNNKTLLEMWLEKFSQLRVKNIIINTHHLAEKINNFVKKNFTRLMANNITGISINTYNAFTVLISLTNLSHTLLQIILIIVNLLVYTFLYMRLFKYK